jgi:hypothetical protein
VPILALPLSLEPDDLVFRMQSYGMLRYVALGRTDVSEELSASFIRVTRFGELATTLAVTSNRRRPFLKDTAVLLGLTTAIRAELRQPRHCNSASRYHSCAVTY